MAEKSQVIHSRMKPALKRSAEAIFEKLGLTTAEAIRLFFKQVELRRGLPFDVRIPNPETLKAIQDIDHRRGLKRQTLSEFKKSLR